MRANPDSTRQQNNYKKKKPFSLFLSPLPISLNFPKILKAWSNVEGAIIFFFFFFFFISSSLLQNHLKELQILQRNPAKGMFTHPNQPSMELTTKYNEKLMPQTQIHPKKKEKESTQQFQLAILLQSCNTQATKNNIDNNITIKKNSKPHYKAISLHRPCNRKPSNAYLNKDKKN